MYEARDPYRYVLERPVADPPGEVYNYCTGAPSLLGAVLRCPEKLPTQVSRVMRAGEIEGLCTETAQMKEQLIEIHQHAHQPGTQS